MGIGDVAKQAQAGLIAGQITTTQKEAFFIEGKAFTQSEIHTLGAGEVKNFIISPKNYAPDAEQIYNRIFLEIPTMTSTDGPLRLEFFNSPVITTPGASLTMPSFNRDSANLRTAQLELTQDPILSSPGDPVSQLLLPTSAAGVNISSAAVGPSPLPYGLKNDEDTLFRVTNQGGAGNQVEIRLYWYEI
jgi:hypothetical protein